MVTLSLGGMHQLALAQRIGEEIAKAGLTRPVLKVGELLAVDADELISLLATMGHEVRIESIPSRVRCPCGFQGRAEVYHRDHTVTLFRCPRCNLVPKVERGKELEMT